MEVIWCNFKNPQKAKSPLEIFHGFFILLVWNVNNNNCDCASVWGRILISISSRYLQKVKCRPRPLSFWLVGKLVAADDLNVSNGNIWQFGQIGKGRADANLWQKSYFINYCIFDKTIKNLFIFITKSNKFLKNFLQKLVKQKKITRHLAIWDIQIERPLAVNKLSVLSAFYLLY